MTEPERNGAPEPPSASAARSIDSKTLLPGGRMLVIRHGAEAYRLQLTRSGKLILTK